MFVARVLGRVVATRKLEGLTGVPLLWIQRLDEDLQPVGSASVAADRARSGLGDIVLVEDGREATFALPERFVAVEAAIVGHIESIDVTGEDPTVEREATGSSTGRAPRGRGRR